MSDDRRPRVDFYEMAARAAMPSLQGLEACGWRVAALLNDHTACRIEWAKSKVFKSGPRKGKKGWGKVLATVTVTTADAKRAQEVWIASGGRCVRCLDEGKLFVSWTKGIGTTYEPCVCQIKSDSSGVEA